jgi:ABC-type multidrug transport system fused ATPase/permease subunit
LSPTSPRSVILALRRNPWLVVARALAPEGGRLGRLGAGLLLATLLPLAGPQLIARFVDTALAGGSLGLLMALAGGYLVVAIAGQAASVAGSYLASGVAWRTTNRLRERVAAHALNLDMAFHARHTPGEMIERVDGDLHALTQFISGFVVQALGSLLLLAGTMVLVWFVDLRVGAVLTAVVVVGGPGLLLIQRRVVHHAVELREATARMFGSIEERLVAVDEIRANGAGAHVVGRFHEDAARVLTADSRWQRRSGAVLAGANALFAIGTALMLVEGIVLRQAGVITIGTIVLLFQYAQMVRNPVEQILGQAKQLHEAGAAATRVAGLLAEPPSILWLPAPRRLPATGALELGFRGVTFAYPGDPAVLHDIDLQLRAGRSLGLVGRTGSGKTTVARLALRLYDPTQGWVQLAGIDLRELGCGDLRTRARMVTQDVHVFAASIRDNVTMFDNQFDDTAIVAALDAVGLGSWRRGLADGLDSMLGAGGLGLSAGEAQLLAVARVFLADPGLLVLDEASSRLDPATEEVVRHATQRLLEGRTAIVIAHRLATLEAVDEIAVIEGGRIVERGPRASLARAGTSRFARLFAESEPVS